MSISRFRAFVATEQDTRVNRGVTELDISDLAAAGVLIDVQASSVNYKDALATIRGGQVAGISPLVPGIDLAGVVLESDVSWLAPGDAVLAHGYAIGTSQHGGYAERARVPAEWIVSLPVGLTAREAMIIGTAGFTAALSVIALENHGIEPGSGPILVTGASGGVGSMAVDLLARRGFTVVASTGTPAAEPYLRKLGAAEVLPRAQLSDPDGRLLRRPRWAACVDAVGGHTLANVLAQLHPSGVAAATGLTGGSGLPTSVLPFITRGVTLVGIDSVNLPIDQRRSVWDRLANDLRPVAMEDMVHEISLEQLDIELSRILAGETTGRVIVTPARAAS
ncbi:acryloyl-CoA reductase [Frankia sp. Cr2]|uniref:acrylyl-CoA reductase family protein n=1 Tax=Frankia sp. Cr2 TaxID=3073932 RepID=UPI002AD3476D|nr:acryloyl-CoA reductase [Frankia sp. Cr2]